MFCDFSIIRQHPSPFRVYALTPYLDDLLAFLGRVIRPFFVLHRFLRGSRSGVEFLCSRRDMDGSALQKSSWRLGCVFLMIPKP